MNSAGVFAPNVPNEVNLPYFGGKGVVTFKQTKDGYETVVDSKKFGKINYTEKYTDEGFTMVRNLPTFSLKYTFLNFCLFG